jgi:hypothetical protein
VTQTDIGILLIVLCVLLWAILAALHRHTVQLNMLRALLEKLVKEFDAGRDEGSGATPDEFATWDRTGQNRIFRTSRKF